MKRFLSLMMVLLVAGCSLLGVVDYSGNRVEREETETWDANLVSRVVVQNVNGHVDVKVGGGGTASAKITRFCTGKDQADAEANIDRVVVSVVLAGGVLTVQVNIPDNDPRTFGADIEITVSQNTHVDLQSTNGHIEVTNINANMELQTTNGHITTHGVRGMITAQTTNGQLDIDMSELLAPHAITLSSTNGAVKLTIPDRSSAMFTLTTTNGLVEVTGFSDITYTVNMDKNKVGVIGTGAAIITGTSTNGGVTLRAKTG